MTKPIEIDDASFDQTVLQAEMPVLVDFWASWCRPCLMLAPILEELAGEYQDKITFVKMDVDQNPKAASRYGIMSIPTLIVFKKGAPAANMVGYKPKAELKRELDEALG